MYLPRSPRKSPSRIKGRAGRCSAVSIKILPSFRAKSPLLLKRQGHFTCSFCRTRPAPCRAAREPYCTGSILLKVWLAIGLTSASDLWSGCGATQRSIAAPEGAVSFLQPLDRKLSIGGDDFLPLATTSVVVRPINALTVGLYASSGLLPDSSRCTARRRIHADRNALPELAIGPADQLDVLTRETGGKKGSTMKAASTRPPASASSIWGKGTSR